MSLTVLTSANSRRLCSIMDVLDEMPEPVTLVERFVDQASAGIERYCHRIFAQQAYREVLSPERSRLLMLQHTPVVSLLNVAYGSEIYTDARIESADAGILYRREGWYPWGWDEWTIEYVAGYILPGQTNAPEDEGEPLPDDVQRACMEAVKVWWAERELTDRVASKTLGLTGDRIEYRISASKESLPPLARNLLLPWKRMVLA